MHITNDILINTAAMAYAMNIDQALLDKWGQGCVELYASIGDWATIVTEEERHLSDTLNDQAEAYPGVFAYEVTEAVASEIHHLIQLNIVPTEPRGVPSDVHHHPRATRSTSTAA